MIKVGIIGCGGMGYNHACAYAGLKDMVEVAAVADVREAFLEKTAKRFDCQTFKTGMALIENADVDFVDICLPTYLHTEHAVAAMKKGFHVFVEKPICLNAEEADLLLKTQQETGKKVQVGHVVRFTNQNKFLKELNDTQKYGRLVSAAFARISACPSWSFEDWFNNPDKSGTAALDLHIHDTDYVRFLLGEPEGVSSNASRDADGVLEHIYSVFKYPGTIVTVEGGWDHPNPFPFMASFVAKFEKASVLYNSHSEPLTVYPLDGEPYKPDFSLPESANPVNADAEITTSGGIFDELKSFCEALINDTPVTVAPLDEAVKSAKLVFKEIELAGGIYKK